MSKIEFEANVYECKDGPYMVIPGDTAPGHYGVTLESEEPPQPELSRFRVYLVNGEVFEVEAGEYALHGTGVFSDGGRIVCIVEQHQLAALVCLS